MSLDMLIREFNRTIFDTKLAIERMVQRIDTVAGAATDDVNTTGTVQPYTRVQLRGLHTTLTHLDVLLDELSTLTTSLNHLTPTEENQ